MSTQLLLILQLIADVVLCVVILGLIFVIGREMKLKRNVPDEESLREFQRLLNESQAATNNLSEVMEESRKALKEIAFVLDKKEKELRALIKESKSERDRLNVGLQRIENGSVEKKYDKVISMFKEGLTKKEISHMLDLPEGEIDLIVDLDRTKYGT